MSRFTSGLILGGGISGGYSAVGASPKTRVAIPTALAVALAIVLPSERDLAAGVLLGALGVSAGVSKAQNRPMLEFLPSDVRDAIEQAPRRLRGGAA